MSSARNASIRPAQVGWRESNRISPANLAEYIKLLETACQHDPQSADLRICLGIAQDKNYQSHKSLESFQTAIELDSSHFFARLKYGEVLLRHGLLHSAEAETRIAVKLANSRSKFSMACRQLQSIWSRLHEEFRPPSGS